MPKHLRATSARLVTRAPPAGSTVTIRSSPACTPNASRTSAGRTIRPRSPSRTRCRRRTARLRIIWIIYHSIEMWDLVRIPTRSSAQTAVAPDVLEHAPEHVERGRDLVRAQRPPDHRLDLLEDPVHGPLQLPAGVREADHQAPRVRRVGVAADQAPSLQLAEHQRPRGPADGERLAQRSEERRVGRE